ncbi:MAG: ribbon-helix-helix protein, CopG family [bacterium]
MRTTITLDDRLLAQLKKRASESGTSVSRLVEQAIRLLIRTPPVGETAGPLRLGDLRCGRPLLPRESRQDVGAA